MGLAMYITGFSLTGNFPVSPKPPRPKIPKPRPNKINL